MRNWVTTLVIAIVAVAGITAYALERSPSGGSAGQGATTTSSGSATAAALGLNNSLPPPCDKLVKTVSSQGYAISTFLSSTSARSGDVVCINLVVLNMDGRNLTLGSDEGFSISYNVTMSNGAVVYQKTCATPTSESASGNATSSANPIGSWSCGGFWFTGAAYDGTVPSPGTYDIVAKASVPNIVGGGQSTAGSTATLSLSD